MKIDQSGDEAEQITKETAHRLKCIMDELGFKAVADLAREVKAGRSQVSNWLQAYHLPPVLFMSRLVRRYKLTLDYIYLGIPDGLSHGAAERLMAREQGLQPPESEPEPPLPPTPEAAAKVVQKASEAASKVKRKAEQPKPARSRKHDHSSV